MDRYIRSRFPQTEARLPKYRAFTLIELLVVVAIIAILASLLFPALARSRDKGKTAKCQSNARQLALAAMMFEDDNQVYPVGWTDGGSTIWYRQLQPYLGRRDTVSGEGVFICPSSLQKPQSTEKVRTGLREGGFWGFLAYAQMLEQPLRQRPSRRQQIVVRKRSPHCLSALKQ